jgi:hypothetical protein
MNPGERRQCPGAAQSLSRRGGVALVPGSLADSRPTFRHRRHLISAWRPCVRCSQQC